MVEENKGLTFRKIHCSDLGLSILDDGTSRPLLPESKDTYVDVPHRSGSVLVYDESKKDIDVEVTFLLHDPKSNIYDSCRDIASWLTTKFKAPLIFDDDPDFFYLGKAVTSVTFEDIEKMYGQFTVTWRCDPKMLPISEVGNH